MAGKREEQMKEITERLELGVKELFTSEMYTEYLKTMSQFHNYSFNNTLLIAMQKPDATLVAGFQAWQKKFERHVKRGEKGIQIIAPAPIKEKQEMEKIDPVTQEPVLRSDGQPETEEVEIVIPRFRVTSVFDVSQTEGKPLPEIDTPELMGSVENFEYFMESIERVSPVPIRFAEMDSDTKGYYHQIDKEIVIQEGMSESQTMKTTVHEVTHAMLHDRELMKESGEWKSQMTREVEAESVAFTVCQYFGLDTSDYSFPYIAGWSSHMDMKELRVSMDTIRKTAGDFTRVMTETMQELIREQPLKVQLEEQDLVFKVSGSMGMDYAYYMVRNMEKKELLAQLHSYHELYSESGEIDLWEFLVQQGVKLIPWYDSEEVMEEYPINFYDVEYDFDTGILDATELSVMEQATMLIDRAEYQKTYFNSEEKNLIVNYAFKLDSIENTKKLIQGLIGAMADPDPHALYIVKEMAETEINALPDGTVGLVEMHQYGYRSAELLPLSQERAMQLYQDGMEVFCLYPDDTEAVLESEKSFQTHDGLFGVEVTAWERYRNVESVQKVNNSLDRQNEELLLNGTENRYGIYQIDRDGKGREYSFMNLDFVKNHGMVVDHADYNLIYSDVLIETDTLNALYEKFKISHPADFMGHSLSVSDVVVFRRGEEIKAYYVDSVGFTEIPEFIRQHEVKPEVRKALEGEEIPIYKYTGNYASEHMEAHWYRMSMRANVDCKGAIEAAITENFDGMHLKHDVVNPVLTAFGADRVSYVLANTVQRKEWDGRFSRDNKEWARTIPVVEDKEGFGGDRRNEFIVDSHPAVLDGFIGLARKEIEALTVQREAGQSKEEAALENHDTEIAYQIAEKYFAIQTTAEGYDYTFYDQNYQALDGGVYDNTDISIQGAIEDILSDEGISISDCKVISYEKLQEQVESVQQVMGAMPLISDKTEPEAALNNLSPAEIEETVLCYAQSKIDEIGLAEDVKLLGARVYGSRSREGAYIENSDMDVVISYSGEMREDTFFNMLHEDGLQLAGLPVDINPISTETTGTLKEYLEKANQYLDEKESQISADTTSIDNPTMETAEAKISFYAAECMEYTVLGEFHENLSLQEAMEVYQSIPSERMNAIKGIGFCLEDGSMYDGNFDLMSGGKVLKDIINDIPHYLESPLVQKAIKDMEELLSEQEKQTEKAPKVEKDVSPGSGKKQSVLKALQERKTKLMSQEQEDSKQKVQAAKKGEQEL